ncbi:Pheromone B alpha 1 receptor [Mycena sanguinolenta]|uniref:Pheromone B alpha 1 receptor n=1 Tax=Mycena sanguinolenta TaxID=230812 RepID=A0A8H7DHH5_9AGAR|nr:Pheromone B alpha 1 receptor [Mycena sanguinolenta]
MYKDACSGAITFKPADAAGRLNPPPPSCFFRPALPDMYYYTGPPNWFFSLFAFIGFLCSSIPLPWHLEAWNTGTLWNGNVIDWAPVWCDISTHFLNGFNLAIPACSLCINRRLYHIASVRTVTKTHSEKRKAIMIDLLIGLGLPILQIPLQYIVQGHRYNIFEDIGCLSETYETPVAIVLFHLPPILVGCVSAVYCILSIRSFYNCRTQVKQLLTSNHNLNLNRYLRLMFLAGTDLCFTIPLGIWVLWVNAKVVGISPWISWDDTHSNFSRVVQVPGVIWRSDIYDVASLETTRWLTVAASLLFFAFFGFADEAMKNYRSAFYSVAKRMGYSTMTMSSGQLSSTGPQVSTGRGATIPVFIRKNTTQKRDSFDSFSDVSASAGALTYLDKEKSFGGATSFGDISMGIIPDYKEEADGSDLSDSEPSSGSSRAGTPLPPAGTGSDDDDIDISSLHRASVYLTAPPPRSIPDVPLPIDPAHIV